MSDCTHTCSTPFLVLSLYQLQPSRKLLSGKSHKESSSPHSASLFSISECPHLLQDLPLLQHLLLQLLLLTQLNRFFAPMQIQIQHWPSIKQWLIH
jgi:hypothetical protein